MFKISIYLRIHLTNSRAIIKITVANKYRFFLVTFLREEIYDKPLKNKQMNYLFFACKLSKKNLGFF
jgi:hypothetical protein